MNPTRKRPPGAAIVALVTLAFALAGCGSSSAGSQQDEQIVIGASVSLSGDFSDSGNAVKRGYELWAEQVNAKGGIDGRKVEMKIVDDTSSPNQVATNYQNLITRDKVDFVFGPYSSLLTVPAAQVAKRHGYAFIEPAGGGPAVFEAKLDNLIFVQRAPVTKWGLVFAEWVLSLPEAERPKTAAYAELDDPFAAPLAESIREKLEAGGVETVYKQVYPAGTRDLSPIMTAIAAKKPDLVVGGTQVEDGYEQVRSLVQLDFSPKMMFVSDGASDPLNFPETVGVKNTEGIITIADWFPGAQTTGSQEFVTEYIKKYGGKPEAIDPTSAEAFACGQLLGAVAEKAGKLDNETVIKELHSGTWDYILADGMSWSEHGEPQGAMTLVQWQGGKLVPIFPEADAAADALLPKPTWEH